ncbi:MAG: hypothetical protein ACFCAD_16980 [Pleurocapsa sp.]
MMKLFYNAIACTFQIALDIFNTCSQTNYLILFPRSSFLLPHLMGRNP